MGTIHEILLLEDKFSAAFSKYISLGTDAAAATKAVKEAAQRATAASKIQAAAMNAAAASAKAQTAELKRQKAEQELLAKSSGDLIGKLKSLAGAYIGMHSVQAVVGLSDTLAQTTARLDLMNDGMQTTAELQKDIYDSANRARSVYLDTADAISKMALNAGAAFNGNQEVISFMEQINKQFVIAGASAEDQKNAVRQLTQAMAAGTLRGEELNSILDSAPGIARAIESYMGIAEGSIKEYAEEGKITSDIVKNAMFAAAEETNEKFESMPLTWTQVWTQFQNTVIQAFEPVLDAINWVANHMEQLAPILVGVAAGAITLAAALGIQAAATWIATGAAYAFFAALLSNPLTYIVLIIGLIVAAIYQWIQSVGGLEIAWLIVVEAVLYGWDTLKAGFMTGVYAVQDWLDTMGYAFTFAGVDIQNAMGDMKVGVLTILQNMINGAIGLLNWFIDKINNIPGVAISPIEQMTFAATASLENEAAKQLREQEKAAALAELNAGRSEREKALSDLWNQRDSNHAARQAEIMKKQVEVASGSSQTPGADPYTNSGDGEDEKTLKGISKDVGSIEKAVNLSQEDLQSLVELAERQYVNNINLTAQTPVINITGANTGRTAADRQNLADTIRDILIEQVAAGSVRSTSRAY